MTTAERIRVGDILELKRRSVTVDPIETYREIGVSSFGKGIFHKAPVTGAEIGNKRVFAIEPKDLVLNNVFAWEGSIAVASQSEQGMIGSHRFMTYVPKGERADPHYLHYFFLSEVGINLIRQASPGSAGRNRTLGIDAFEALEIPLPNLAEQIRVAERLQRVSGTSEAALTLARKTLQSIEATWWAILREEFEGLARKEPLIALDEVVDVNPEALGPEREFGEDTFKYVDISSVANGTGQIVHPKNYRGIEAPSRARRKIRSGDVLVSTVRPNLRGFAQVPDELNGQVCSTGFAVLRPKDAVSSRFLLYQVLSDFFLDQLLKSVRGHYPAINDKALRQTHLVIPTPAAQLKTEERLSRVAPKIAQATRLHRERVSRLEALMPSLLNESFRPFL